MIGQGRSRTGISPQPLQSMESGWNLLSSEPGEGEKWFGGGDPKFTYSILPPMWWPSHTGSESTCCCIGIVICRCVLLLTAHTNLMEHYFETFPGLMVCSQPYQFLDHKVQIVHRELSEMLKLGVIESHSVQCSPIVPVVKTDGGAQTMTCFTQQCDYTWGIWLAGRHDNRNLKTRLKN